LVGLIFVIASLPVFALGLIGLRGLARILVGIGKPSEIPILLLAAIPGLFGPLIIDHGIRTLAPRWLAGVILIVLGWPLMAFGVISVRGLLRIVVPLEDTSQIRVLLAAAGVGLLGLVALAWGVSIVARRGGVGRLLIFTGLLFIAATLAASLVLTIRQGIDSGRVSELPALLLFGVLGAFGLVIVVQGARNLSRPGSQWLRRSLVVVGVSAVTLLVVAGIPLYSSHAAEQRWQQAIAEVERLDPGWRLKDLGAKRAVIPDDANSAILVIKAKQLVPASWSYAEAAEALEDAEPQYALDPGQAALLEAELTKITPAMVAARRLKDFPNGRLPDDITNPDTLNLASFGRAQQNLEDAGFSTLLLSYDAANRAQRGEPDGALESCQGSLSAARSMGDEPRWSAQRVRLIYRSIALRAIERALAQGQPSAGSLSDLQALLEDEERQPLLLIGTRAERASWLHVMRDHSSDDLCVCTSGNWKVGSFDLQSSSRVTGRIAPTESLRPAGSWISSRRRESCLG
jgi:hypothetical protein